MKIELKHRTNTIGEIFTTTASKTTKELKGLLIPTKDYQNIRSKINKYNEIFHNPKSKGIIDKFLDQQLKKKYKDLNNWFKEFQITVDDDSITDANTEIDIIDNLTTTGLGNIEISINAWNLNTEILSHDFKIYSIEYAYPSEPKNIIEIKYDHKLIIKY